MTALKHILALLLLLVYPAWDVWETRFFKTSINPRGKLSYYHRIIAVLRISAGLAVAIFRDAVFFIWPSVYESLWQKKINAALVWSLVVAWMAVNLIRAFQRRARKLRDSTVTALKRLGFFLPATTDERRWFAVVSITAGICEEVLYRGFLIRYFCAGPWHVRVTLAIVISSAAFGLAHTYQGLGGIVSSGCLGAIMAMIFFITGSLWLPILLHAFIDLNMLLLLRRGNLLRPSEVQ